MSQQMRSMIEGSEAEKQLATSIAALVQSANEASGASDKNSRALNYLTGALLFVAIIQGVVATAGFLQRRAEIKQTADCYRAVLTTSDIELNFKNCLRDKGLSN